jgi:hypothetical protein
MESLEEAQAHRNRGSIMAKTETVPTIGPAGQQSEEPASAWRAEHSADALNTRLTPGTSSRLRSWNGGRGLPEMNSSPVLQNIYWIIALGVSGVLAHHALRAA